MADPQRTIPPLLRKRGSVKTFILWIVASDTGLCGTYNHRLFELADDFISQYALEAEIQLVLVGKKGMGHFKKMDLPVLKSYLESYGRFSLELSQRISQDLQDLFFSSPEIQIFVAYTKFKSLMRWEPTIELLFEPPEPAGVAPVEYMIEPDWAKILPDLTYRYFLKRVQCILLEAFISEHTSRMISMRQAKDNAEELLSDLTLLKNKLRQAVITTEITEIVSAVEALKG